MSDTGRAYLELIFGSAEYKTWAARLGNKTDANKIRLEFEGQRRPSPASMYAKGLVGLCRENPPVPVPPVPQLASVWQRDAVFTNGALSNFHGAARERARQLGWTAVYVQLMHTTYADANEQEIPVFLGAGWTPVGWGTYGQDTDPYDDGMAAAAICKRIPSLAGWKANGEAWAEGIFSWKTEAFLNGWNAGGAPVPLGWSVLSSDTANFPRDYAYGVAMSVTGADIDIQVYGATYPSYTVGAGLGMLSKAQVPVSRTTMSFDVNGNGVGPFPDYLTWKGPRRLWQPDRATVSTFDALAR